MTEPWTEVEDAGAVVIAFDGIDADKRDAAELAAFTRDLATPAREDEHVGRASGSPWIFDRGSTQSLTSAMRAMPYLVLGVVTGWLAMWGGAAFAEFIGAPLQGLGQILLFFLGLLTPVSVAVFRDWRAHATRRAVPRDHFTFRLDAAGLSVAGERSAMRTFDLDVLDGFEPGRRLAVRKRDGTHEQLPCVLPLAGDHAALAARLDAALRNVRAATAGYRGAPAIRVAVETVEVTGDNDDDDDDDVASSAGKNELR